jgi:hypothetical protein
MYASEPIDDSEDALVSADPGLRPWVGMVARQRRDLFVGAL